jgi:hypothetical protein
VVLIFNSMDTIPNTVWVSDNTTGMVLPVDTVWLYEYQQTDVYKKLFTQKITDDNLQDIITNEKSKIVKKYLSREVIDKKIRVTPVLQKILPDCDVLISMNCNLEYKYDIGKARENNVNPYLLIRHICTYKLMIPRGESICHSSWLLFLSSIVKAEPETSDCVFYQLISIIKYHENNISYKESLKDISIVISDILQYVTIQMFRYTVKMLGLPRKNEDDVLEVIMCYILKQVNDNYPTFSDIVQENWFDEKYVLYQNDDSQFALEKVATMFIDEHFKYYIDTQSTKSQIIIPIILNISPSRNADVCSHYNVLIIDMTRKSVYLFEPHMDNTWHNELWYILKYQILNNYFPGDKFNWDSSQSYTYECPAGSIQNKDNFCQTWIILVTAMHILNPVFDKLAVYKYLKNNDDIELKYKIIILFQHYLYHMYM